ncbi:hypothetical protein ACFQU9_19335 [Actinomadura namibiensis]|uniref:Uncharacterized protein n=1 Tax=Actinomadura namibiensis TaxID=182080 RepID=A0A7W3LRH3_ACTNM|nr:hypothetical protein [Actinomadura namibiensis]MBA8952939.1 hypothetical protein [Actinomadura namibiensis]
MGAVVSGVVLATPDRACACSCARVTDAEAYARADAVFTGRPALRESENGGSVTLVFEVSAVHKGQVARRQGVRTASSGAGCGLEVAMGREYLVFVTRDEGGPAASLCGGTRAADRPLAVPSAPTGTPLAGRAGPVDEGLSSTAWVMIAGGLAVPIVLGLVLASRRRS